MAGKPATGKCWFVGAGPGDVGLVTLRARELIEHAEVIVHDARCNPQVLQWAAPQAEITAVTNDASALLVEKARAGKQVVRLLADDVFFFSSGGNEATALADADVAFEIVPGVSALLAAPAFAGIPLSGQDLTKVTFSAERGGPGETRVVAIGSERIGAITAQMIESGVSADLPAALIRYGASGMQQTLVGTMGDIARRAVAEGFEPPLIAVFGKAVALREKLDRFETRPLSGKRIVVTRSRKQAGELSRKLEVLGAEVIELPTIRIEPPSDLRAFAELVQDAHSFDWIVFTSANGVQAFFDLFYKLYDDSREIGGARIAAIGPGTAQRLKEYHMHVDLAPEQSVAESVIKEFAKEGGVENLRILLARAEKARDVLPQELSAMGAIVDEAFAYRTVPETHDASGARRRLEAEGADLITFTSSSTVENFLALKLQWPRGMRVATIGPIASKTARHLGLTVDLESRRHDIPGLVDAIVKFFARK